MKAKSEPEYRFYILYDKVHRWDVLKEAYRLSKEKKGAAGVDGQTFEQIEAAGAETWLKQLQEELAQKRYRPQAVRRVKIPKAGGGERPLGILDHQGPGGTDGDEAHPGADIRGRLAGLCVRVSTRT